MANHILYEFDTSVAEFCKSRAIRYSRYSDDLTFSGSFDVSEVRKFVDRALKGLSFRLNERKSNVMKSNNLQIVTGIVVNKKMNVRRSERRKLRQEAYFITKFGIDSHVERKKIVRPAYMDYIRARIGFCLWVNRNDGILREAAAKLKELAFVDKH